MNFHRFKITMPSLLFGLACMCATLSLRADEAPPPKPPPAGASAPAPAPAKPPASLEQRIADLEAYVVGDGAPSKAGDSPCAAGPVAQSSGAGHVGFMMICTAFVLFMTLPGLALFYGGLVRRKNILSVLAQCMGIAGLATLLWWAVGFSLSFGPGGTFIGDFSKVFLKTVGPGAETLSWVSESVWVVFQLTFAIITPALIVGAIAERMKFTAIMVFVALWSFAVYYPLAHMVWGGGLMSNAADGARIFALDFAGGAVVHMSSGYSALVLCLILGPRLGFRKEKMAPHSMVLCMIGTAILWIGWYGFNAGSAGAANGLAANAFLTTTLAAAIGGFTWAALEYVTKKQASVLGFCSGIVAGLVVITPAAGFVDATGGVICGIAAGVIPFFFCVKVKAWLGYDDALDTFGVHAVGGTVGTVLTGLLAVPEVNSLIKDVYARIAGSGATPEQVAAISNVHLVWEQLKATFVTVGWSVAATVVIAYLIKATIGLRPTAEAESIGLDISDHGEEGYVD
ncbi:MAG: ammonium transporter [Puniceicoccales bacterium]|jgi:Amt family ammonium transporter|nr:ammonium transporter [Puniceicoccales bacterium]